MSEPTEESARPEISFEAAKEVALRLLSAAPRTRADLIDRLTKRGASAEVAEAAVERMAELGYVDDVAYAEAFVSSRRRAKNHGYHRLRMDLMRKGVPPSIVADALADDVDHARAAAQEFIRVALRKSGSTPPDKLFRRIYGAAIRAGHSPGLISELLRSELE